MRGGHAAQRDFDNGEAVLTVAHNTGFFKLFCQKIDWFKAENHKPPACQTQMCGMQSVPPTHSDSTGQKAAQIMSHKDSMQMN